jgi:hypothetical protein
VDKLEHPTGGLNVKRTAVISLLTAMLVLVLSVSLASAGRAENSKPYTLAKLTEKIDKLENKEISLTGTVIGICKSGCKMWIADGEYKEGDPFALVRAKDDAFKFEKDATGKKVILYGYAVAKYMDYCAESGEETEGAKKECEAPVSTGKQMEDTTSQKRAVKEVTFFATKVAYK